MFVVDQLMESGKLYVLSGAAVSDDSAVVVQGTPLVGDRKVEVVTLSSAAAAGVVAEESEWNGTPVTLPQYDPLSSATSTSQDAAQLKVLLALLQMEAHEKAQGRQARLELETSTLVPF